MYKFILLQGIKLSRYVFYNKINYCYFIYTINIIGVTTIIILKIK